MRDRPDGSHGAGGLLQVGGPVADALWLQGFGVALQTLCLFVGGMQKEETKITISTRKKSEHSLHHRHVCTVQKHTPFSVCNRTPSPIWLKCRCFQLAPRPTLERHLGGLVCVSRTNPPGVVRGAPPRLVDCPGGKCAWHPGRHRDQCRLLWRGGVF